MAGRKKGSKGKSYTQRLAQAATGLHIGAVVLEARAEGESVVVQIRDDGPGVDPVLRAQVFEPFFTTRSGGTGLGLYIARELSEANGAVLELRDAAPGATFCLTLKGAA